jgi:cytochrome c553
MNGLPVGFKLLVVVGFVTALYSTLGNLAPQQEIHPPSLPPAESPRASGIEELVQRGRTIFEGRGTCTVCHTVDGAAESSPFPDLAGIGVRAGQRVPGLDAVAYLTQSLYQPTAFVVEGFHPVMPAVNGPPMNLAEDEALAVIAYLQSLGGEPTVGPDTRLPIDQVAALVPGAVGISTAGSPPPLEMATFEPGSPSEDPPGGDQGGQLYARSCAPCHGDQGEGVPVLNAPRLAGMEPWYIVRQLRNFSSGARGADPADTFGRQMRVIATTLGGDGEIEDVAAYVATMR